VPVPDDSQRFNDLIEIHLDAAYNLARWLTRNSHDAEDLVQESALRAWKAFSGFHGGSGRAWLLAIVRNTCYTFLKQNRARELMAFDESVHTPVQDVPQPEQMLLRNTDASLVRDALEALPVEFREAVVLRELEGMSYKEIAEVAGIPIGTVMSRLARGRQQLQQQLLNPPDAKKRAQG
jgi:RNA polymerase sigma-70 factor, ECF subfamily